VSDYHLGTRLSPVDAFSSCTVDSEPGKENSGRLAQSSSAVRRVPVLDFPSKRISLFAMLDAMDDKSLHLRCIEALLPHSDPIIALEIRYFPTFDCVTLTPRDRRNKAFSAKTADDWIGLDWTAEAWVCKDTCMLADNIKATWNEANERNTVPSARAGKIGHSEAFRLPIARLSPLSSVGFNRFPDRFAISLRTAGLPAVNRLINGCARRRHQSLTAALALD
ncbi:hypothetical protein B0H13DRAFT_2477619, partial [Mycena leptocephala]